MLTKLRRFDWLRANVLQQLSRVDRVIATVLAESRGMPGVRGDEPWVDELFERRQSVQSTLFELERQAGLAQRSDR